MILKGYSSCRPVESSVRLSAYAEYHVPDESG